MDSEFESELLVHKTQSSPPRKCGFLWAFCLWAQEEAGEIIYGKVVVYVFQEAMKMTLKWIFLKKLHSLNHKNAFPAQETRRSNARVEPTSNWVRTQQVSSAQRYRVTLTADLRCQDFYLEDRTRVLKSVLPTYFESEILIQVLQDLLFKSYIGGVE